MRKNLFMLLIAVLSFGFANAQTNGKREHVIKDVKATKMVPGSTRGSTKAKPTTDVIVEAPTNRGSGSYCYLTFDNYTGYNIDIWVDGNYKGWVEAWGKGDVTVYGGYTSWYAESAGGGYSWSNSGDCFSDWYINLRY